MALPAIALAIGAFLDEALEGSRSEPVAGLLMATGTMVVARDFYLAPEELASVAPVREGALAGARSRSASSSWASALLAALRRLRRPGGARPRALGQRRRRRDLRPARERRRGRSTARFITRAAATACRAAIACRDRLRVLPAAGPRAGAVDALLVQAGARVVRASSPSTARRSAATASRATARASTAADTPWSTCPPRTSSSSSCAIRSGCSRWSRRTTWRRSTPRSSTAQVAYYVIDASSSRFLLISNQLGAGETDAEPAARRTSGWRRRRRGPNGGRRPTSSRPGSGASRRRRRSPTRSSSWAPTSRPSVRRPGKIPLDLYLPRQARGRPRGFKIFVHFDGPAAPRVIGDHDPVNHAFGTGFWLPGEYIRDHYDTDVPLMTTPAGTYTVSWASGRAARASGSRSRSGPNDGSDRVRLGTLEIK